MLDFNTKAIRPSLHVRGSAGSGVEKVASCNVVIAENTELTGRAMNWSRGNASVPDALNS